MEAVEAAGMSIAMMKEKVAVEAVAVVVQKDPVKGTVPSKEVADLEKPMAAAEVAAAMSEAVVADPEAKLRGAVQVD